MIWEATEAGPRGFKEIESIPNQNTVPSKINLLSVIQPKLKHF